MIELKVIAALSYRWAYLEDAAGTGKKGGNMEDEAKHVTALWKSGPDTNARIKLG